MIISRSPESLANSAITLPTPISTIHFGNTARHTIDVAWNKGESRYPRQMIPSFPRSFTWIPFRCYRCAHPVDRLRYTRFVNIFPSHSRYPKSFQSPVVSYLSFCSGFHGCSMNAYESYPSSLNASLSDSFTINAKKCVFNTQRNQSPFDAS